MTVNNLIKSKSSLERVRGREGSESKREIERGRERERGKKEKGKIDCPSCARFI